MKKKVLDYLIQLTIVIFGVFIGMGATEWRSLNKDEKYKKEMLLSIKREIENNVKYLENRQANELRFINSLDSITKIFRKNPSILKEKFQEKRLHDIFPNWPGLGKPSLDNSMFEAAKSSNKLSEIEISVLQQVTKTYSMQYNADNFNKMLLNKFLYFNENSSYNEALSYMWTVAEEYFGYHVYLIKEYRKTIEVIDSEVN